MINIIETLKVPSAAVDAVINGLETQSKRSDFKINMSTFGNFMGGICYGCAATCAVQEISKVLLDTQICDIEDRAYAMDFDIWELDTFEDSIDSFRKGDFRPLFLFFNEEEPLFSIVFRQEHDIEGEDDWAPWFLETDNWRTFIPLMKEYSELLKQNGL